MGRYLLKKITVYDDTRPIVITVYHNDVGAPLEVRIDSKFWSTCENGCEVDKEIKYIIDLYQCKFFPYI